MPAVRAPRLLVLGAGPPQLGLLSAARRLGVLVVAADRDPSAPGFRYCQRRAIVSVEDEPALERLARAERSDGIAAAGSDRSVAIAARIASRLGLSHHVSPDAASRAVSPQRRREALEAAGVAQPRAALARTLADVRRAADELGYPCLVRAADRPGQDRVARAADAVAGAAAEAVADSRTEHWLVEAIPPGRRLVVSAFLVAGGFHCVLVAARDPDVGVALAYSWPAAAEPSEIGTAIDAAAAAAAALELDAGPFHAEVVCGEGGACVAEATPRLGGGHDGELARVAVGIDLNELAVRAALGEEVTAGELSPSPRVGGACVRFLVAPAGDLREVAGLEEAFSLPAIRGIRVYRRPGHVFGEVARASDRAGAVLAIGADAADALEHAARAAETIRFETGCEAVPLRR
jgi:biotin carboxylase